MYNEMISNCVHCHKQERIKSIVAQIPSREIMQSTYIKLHDIFRESWLQPRCSHFVLAPDHMQNQLKWYKYALQTLFTQIQHKKVPLYK